jgi:hypothetical protein
MALAPVAKLVTPWSINSGVTEYEIEGWQAKAFI